MTRFFIKAESGFCEMFAYGGCRGKKDHFWERGFRGAEPRIIWEWLEGRPRKRAGV